MLLLSFLFFRWLFYCLIVCCFIVLHIIYGRIMIMASPKKQFKGDSNLEIKGVKIQYDGFSVTIARAGGANTKYRELINALGRDYRNDIRSGTLPPEKELEMMAVVYARTIILDWDVTDEKNNPIPCTEKNIVKELLDCPDWFADLQAKAMNVAYFRKRELEDELKK